MSTALERTKVLRQCLTPFLLWACGHCTMVKGFNFEGSPSFCSQGAESQSSKEGRRLSPNFAAGVWSFEAPGLEWRLEVEENIRAPSGGAGPTVFLGPGVRSQSGDFCHWTIKRLQEHYLIFFIIPVRVSARKLEPLTAQNRSNFLPVLSQPCIEQLPVRRLAFSKSSPEDPKSLRKLGHIVLQTIANLTFGEFKFGHRKILDFLQTSQDPQC